MRRRRSFHALPLHLFPSLLPRALRTLFRHIANTPPSKKLYHKHTRQTPRKQSRALDLHAGSRLPQGFVKLCDFGFAKKLKGDRTFTRCGTPDYTSPEMLINDGVNLACDWWGLGVLMFELLTGDLPFSDSGGDEMRTYQNILHANLDWNYDPILRKPDVRSIMEGFLTVKVAYRLGYLMGGAQVHLPHLFHPIYVVLLSC